MKVSHNSHFEYVKMISGESVTFRLADGSLKKALCKGMVPSLCEKQEGQQAVFCAGAKNREYHGKRMEQRVL